MLAFLDYDRSCQKQNSEMEVVELLPGNMLGLVDIRSVSQKKLFPENLPQGKRSSVLVN